MVKSYRAFGSIATVSTVGFLFACCQTDSRTAANEPPLQQPETGAAGPSTRPVGPDHKPKRIALFNGKDLSGWKVIEASLFDQHGEVKVESGQIVIGLGNPASGIHLAKKPPRDEYEISFQARRVKGSDFFCGLTFPVRDQYCSLIIGGWGGTTVGLSNLDGMAAVENETTSFLDIKQGKWYSIRLRVADGHIRVWIDKEQKIDVDKKPNIDVEIAEHQFSIWWEQEPARPLGITTWNTKAEYKDLFMTLMQSQDTTSNRGTRP